MSGAVEAAGVVPGRLQEFMEGFSKPVEVFHGVPEAARQPTQVASELMEATHGKPEAMRQPMEAANSSLFSLKMLLLQHKMLFFKKVKTVDSKNRVGGKTMVKSRQAGFFIDFG